MVVGARPDTFQGGLDGMPNVPGVLPGQDIEGGSECEYDVSQDGSVSTLVGVAGICSWKGQQGSARQG